MMMYLSTVVLLAIIYWVSAVEAESRIVNGAKAKSGQFPYQVAIFYGDDFACGGSIIHEKYVLTAAHCIRDEPDLKVLVGTNTLSNGTFYYAKNAIKHEHYVNPTNDIALIELTSNIEFGPKVKKISLYSEEVKNHHPLIISGWGSTTKLQEAESDSLLLIYERKMKPKFCQQYLHNHSVDIAIDGILCAKTEPRQGVCSGDSGSPLVIQSKNSFIQVGVTSFVISEKAKNNCASDKPIINFYTKVSYYLDWINDKIEN